MNCGLTNRATLRKHLLASSLASNSQFDEVIQMIGLGVAGRFDKFCNRTLAYQDSAEIIFTGNRRHYILPRYPLISIGSVQMRYFDQDPWLDITGQPVTTNAGNGIINFGGTLGEPPLQVKVVWTGGYWFETGDEGDEGFPADAPASAALLPDDLRAAFLWQCKEVWAQQDKLGLSTIEKPGAQSGLASLKLAPLVEEILRGYIRYQLS